MMTPDVLQKKRRYLPNILILSLYLSFSIFFFLPSLLYYQNFLNFTFSFSDIYIQLIGLATIFFFIILIILLAIPESVTEKSLVFLSIFGLIIWFQATVFIWNYGPFDGSPKQWDNFFLNGIIELIVYLGLIVVGIRKYRVIYRYSNIILGALFITQIAIIAPMIINSPEEPIYKGYTYSIENQFDFSPTENVIIIVLDSFQSNIFQEILDEDRSIKDEFPGFIYYKNSAGGYPYTSLAIPTLLSGEFYLNNETFSDYLRDKAYPKFITTVLKQAGYDVDFYSNYYPHPSIASNIEKLPLSFNTVKPLLTLAGLRISPHFVKIAIYNDVIPLLTSSSNKNLKLEFYNNMLINSRVANMEKIFKFYHLGTPHAPYTLNASLQEENLPNDREGYKEYARAALVILKGLTYKLQELGIYNNSVLIVVGDHGACFSSVEKSVPLEINHNITQKMGCGLPLVLIKPFNKSGPMESSENPVSLSDIPITVMFMVNLSQGTYEEYSGIPIYPDNTIKNRTRRYYDYDWDPAYSDKLYFPPLKEYLIEGDSWDSLSWHASGRVFTENGTYIFHG